MLFAGEIGAAEAKLVPLRVLAHLGDAVFELHERERQALTAASARQLHGRVVARVSAAKQAELLALILPELDDAEQDIVRRARNLKGTVRHKSSQAAYRQATAFEALVGYLYLTDRPRLRHLLDLTVPGYPCFKKKL